MGVKHFFIWLRKNFPATLQTIRSNDTFTDYDINVDNLCLDMNGIFHTCAQKIYQYGSYEKKSLLRKQQYKKGQHWRIKLFEQVCESIEYYRKLVKPKKRILLCVDGVAGRAKMNQQRQRRYRSEKLENCDFETASITPGTQFMDNLSKYIEWYCRVMITNSPDWEGIEVIYSGDKVPGEGEHKIINYIRHNDNDSETYCIHGLDADLIMLSLSTKLKSMYVLRENIRNSSELHLIDIGKLSTQLAYHLKWDREQPKPVLNNGDGSDGGDGDGDELEYTIPKKYERFSISNSIDDFVFMCFLVGNDFVPTIPTLAILDGGIDSMIDTYKMVGRSYGHLTRISRKSKDTTVVFRQKALEVFLGSLAAYESGLMEEKYNKKADFIEDPLLQMSMGPITVCDGTPLQKINFEKYKQLFYERKLKIPHTDQQTIDNVCENYLRGLQWVLTYYKKGMPDWNWSYSDYYAPFLCDLSRVAGKSQIVADGVPFTLNSPVEPYMQLVCVLPPRCHTLLPQPMNILLNSDDSPIKHLVPDTVDVDCSGKRQEWEGIVLVPIITDDDMNTIQKYYNVYKQHLQQKHERFNCVKQSVKFNYNKYIKNFTYKSYYGEIPNCKVKIELFDI
jgi:5'-3' exoribonuclease 1